MPESTPTPGSGLQPAPQGPRRIGPIPLAIGILATVVVLGVVTGLVVMLARGGGLAQPDPPPPPPSSSDSNPSWPTSADPSDATPSDTSPSQTSAPPPPATEPAGPPVSVGNLPTSGDLTWPDGSWDSGETADEAGEEPVSQCQTWRPSQLAELTGSAGREYELKAPIKGRATRTC